VSQGSVRLELLTGVAVVDGERLTLTDRQSELLALLCVCGGYASADALASLLWPEAPRNEAFMAVWIDANDLRRVLPNPSMLRLEPHGYVLDADVALDLWDIDEYLRAHRCASRPRCAIDRQLYGRLVRFHETQRFRIARWRWSRSLRELADRYRRDVGLWLAWGLLAEQRVYEAHGVARDLVATYPSCRSSRGVLETVQRRMAAYAGTAAIAG